MSDKPIQLRATELQPDPDVVHRLEVWLAEAKAGRIVGFVAMAVTPGRGNVRTRVGDLTYSDVVWLCEVVKYDMLQGSAELDEHVFTSETPEKTDDD